MILHFFDHKGEGEGQKIDCVVTRDIFLTICLLRASSQRVDRIHQPVKKKMKCYKMRELLQNYCDLP